MINWDFIESKKIGRGARAAWRKLYDIDPDGGGHSGGAVVAYVKCWVWNYQTECWRDDYLSFVWINGRWMTRVEAEDADIFPVNKAAREYHRRNRRPRVTVAL